MRLFDHRKVNNLLTIVVIGFGVYLIALPWLPNLTLFWNKRFVSLPNYSFNLTGAAKPDDNVQFPAENRIVIPKIALDSEIFSGGPNALNKGPWQRPNTSTPLAGGNTVIAGHRYSYGIDGKWIFYHLDKLELGDRIGVYWQGKEYVYVVNQSKVVEATAVYIEGPTTNDQLTLYTCTPLWTAEKRLVVTADLIEVNANE